MSYFRINIYLKIKYFLLSFFISNKSVEKKISTILNNYTAKENTVLTSQLRVGFYLLLKYLKNKYPQKNEIILNSYNLAEMVNICKNLGLKIVFTKLNENIFLLDKDLKKKINKKTLAVVATNIFNNSYDLKKIKKICKLNQLALIEDNAIYFGNYIKKNNKKIYSGTYGDYSLHSFNIMKSVSAMYGGSVSTNDKKFIDFTKKEMKNFKGFPILKYIKQCLIYVILKLLSIKLFYKIFFRIITEAHKKNNRNLLSLVYPSIKFKKEFVPNNYFTKINSLSLKMILLQLQSKKYLNYNHKLKKENNIYYDSLFRKRNIKDIKLINLKEVTFQNFNDFPIIIKNKKILVNYLFTKGIETKSIQYLDCQNIFKVKNKDNLDYYEEKVLCLPNHIKIKKNYITYIVKCIDNFYKKKIK